MNRNETLVDESHVFRSLKVVLWPSIRAGVMALLLALVLWQPCDAQTGQESGDRGENRRSAASIVGKGNFHAVIVGISRYKDPAIAAVAHAAGEAEEMAQTVRNWKNGHREVRVSLLTDDQATGRAIRDALGAGGKDDTLMFFFSGSAAMASRERHGAFLLAFDSVAANSAETGLSLDYGQMKPKPAGKRTVALVAAQLTQADGPAPSGGGPDVQPFLRNLKSWPGPAIVCVWERPAEPSAARPEARSLFVKSLLESMNTGSGVAKRGTVNMERTYRLVRDAFRAAPRAAEGASLGAVLEKDFPLAVVAGRGTSLVPKGALPSSVESEPPETFTGVQGLRPVEREDVGTSSPR